MGVDVNKPVENPYLKELLAKRKTTPQEDQMKLLNQIAHEMATNAHFLAVVHIDKSSIDQKDDGTAVFNKGSEISFVLLGMPDGSGPVQPVFTDWEELRKMDDGKDGNTDGLILDLDDIYSLVSRDKTPIVINPFGDALLFTFDMLDQIKKVKDANTAGVQHQVVQKDTKVMLGNPKEYPQQMVDSIKRYAENEIEINALWLKLMVKDGEQSFLIIVDAIGDPRSCFPDIANSAMPFIPKGMNIDFVPYDSEFGKSAATGEPFFKR